MGTQKAWNVAHEKRIEGGCACADDSGIDFSKTPLELLNSIPCIIG